VRAVGIIDGEHYADVVRDALDELPYEFVAALRVGGAEKLRGGEDYGVPLAANLDEALSYEPEVVVDLSDEPVLGPRERFLLASRVLARGLPYVGPDFRLEPPLFAPFPLPSIGVVGTGKRVGKTAVSNHAARLLGRDHELVVVAMGRGGPRAPELVLEPPTADRLLELSRSGRHAASDYLEDAVLSRTVTIGARRCGGGLAGRPATSNVLAAAELAAERRPDLVLFEGSGAALPPIATDRRVLVCSPQQGRGLVTGYLNAYRVLVSDLVVVAGAESADRDLRRALGELEPRLPVIACALRPYPIEPVAGRRVVLFSTAPPAVHSLLARHLRDAHGAAGARVFGSLGNREALRLDLEELADAELVLTEIKAAAIDVVAEAAGARGLPVVFVDNEVVPLAGEPDLDAELDALAEAAIAARTLAA
jgi:cyclic 2,3-diphosphoglycerate synthetase